MNHDTQTKNLVFDAIAMATMFATATLLAALVYLLITFAVPFFESQMFPAVSAQGAAKTLVAVFAHGDDETAAAPVLARYAREGVQVHLIIATDGAQGGRHTSIPRGAELAGIRAKEVGCAAGALGIQPPILLGFPDAQLGSYMEDPSRLFQLTARLQGELQRLHADALITWGPDGGTGHPDHRLVSDIVTQLVRAGASGAPERLFYASIPVEGMRAMDPVRGAPPFLVPQAKYLSMHVGFTPADDAAARRAMSCHRTQFSDDVVQRVGTMQSQALNGTLPLAPYLASDAGTDLFTSSR
jgi:LmbE family N-acetylglucosaminyl deacetylase